MRISAIIVFLVSVFAISFGQSMKVHTKGSAIPSSYSLISIDSITFELGSNIDTTRMVAYYPFTDSTNDASGNGHNGTKQGTLAKCADRHGNPNTAYLFNGTNSCITVPHGSVFNYTGSDTISFSFWCRPVSISNQGAILAKANPSGTSNYCIVPNGGSTNKFAFIISHYDLNEWKTSKDTVRLNTWQHVATVCIGKSVTFYINGKLDTTVTFTNTPPTNSDLLYIGNDSDGGQEYFNGAIDDVRIFRRVLTQTDISALAGE